MTFALARSSAVVAVALSWSCTIGDGESKFGAPCTADVDCGRGFACANRACVPADHGEAGEGEAGEGEGAAGEGEGAAGEGEGARDDGCATSCPCSTVCVNDTCLVAAKLAACGSDDTCTCADFCNRNTASCSTAPAPTLRATLTWRAEQNAGDDGPDLDLVATKADANDQFCVTGVPGGFCDTFTPGPKATDCADDSLECFFGTCSLDGDTTNGFTWSHPSWNAANEAGNPVLIGSFDDTAPEVLAVQDLPGDGDYLIGVSFCTESPAGTTSAPYTVVVEVGGDPSAHSFGGTIAEGEYVDVAIVHVSSTNGLSVTAP